MAAAALRSRTSPSCLASQAHHGPALRSRRAGRLRDGDDALRRLVTIPISHYCEKARWALERAAPRLPRGAPRPGRPPVRLATRRRPRHAAGARHAETASSPTRSGSSATPTCTWTRRTGCSPATPRSRRSRARFDATLGPDARRLIYAHMLRHPDADAAVQQQGVPAWEAQALTRCSGSPPAGPGASWRSRTPTRPAPRVRGLRRRRRAPHGVATSAASASPPPT